MINGLDTLETAAAPTKSASKFSNTEKGKVIMWNKLGLELCQAQVWLKVGFRMCLFFFGDKRV